MPRPLVIAHRGASAYRPEHTLAAYELACAQGADLIEPDVVSTRDGVLVCRHDLSLEGTTDVAAEFPDRARADGHWYTADLTMQEIRRLRVVDRSGRMTDQAVPTLDECLDLVQAEGAQAGRTIGVIPELKDPEFHRQAGLAIEGPLLAALRRHGYRTRTDAAIVQCFDLDTLRALRQEHGSDLRLVWLVDEVPSAESLDRAARWVDALGPEKSLILEGGPLVEAARARDLALFPWTFEGDEAQVQRACAVPGVAGLFANDPDVAVRARARWAERAR